MKSKNEYLKTSTGLVLAIALALPPSILAQEQGSHHLRSTQLQDDPAHNRTLTGLEEALRRSGQGPRTSSAIPGSAELVKETEPAQTARTFWQSRGQGAFSTAGMEEPFKQPSRIWKWVSYFIGWRPEVSPKPDPEPDLARRVAAWEALRSQVAAEDRPDRLIRFLGDENETVSTTAAETFLVLAERDSLQEEVRAQFPVLAQLLAGSSWNGREQAGRVLKTLSNREPYRLAFAQLVLTRRPAVEKILSDLSLSMGNREVSAALDQIRDSFGRYGHTEGAPSVDVLNLPALAERAEELVTAVAGHLQSRNSFIWEKSIKTLSALADHAPFQAAIAIQMPEVIHSLFPSPNSRKYDDRYLPAYDSVQEAFGKLVKNKALHSAVSDQIPVAIQFLEAGSFPAQRFLSFLADTGDYNAEISVHLPVIVEIFSSPRGDVDISPAIGFLSFLLQRVQFHPALQQQVPRMVDLMTQGRSSLRTLLVDFSKAGIGSPWIAVGILADFLQTRDVVGDDDLLRAFNHWIEKSTAGRDAAGNAFSLLYQQGFYSDRVFDRAFRMRASKRGFTYWRVGDIPVTSFGVLEGTAAPDRLASPEGASIRRDTRLELGSEVDGGFFRQAHLVAGSWREPFFLYVHEFDQWQEMNASGARLPEAAFLGVSPGTLQVFYLMPWGEILAIHVGSRLDNLLNDFSDQRDQAFEYFKSHLAEDAFMRDEENRALLDQALLVDIPSHESTLENLMLELKMRGGTPFSEDKQIREFLNHYVIEHYLDRSIPRSDSNVDAFMEALTLRNMSNQDAFKRLFQKKGFWFFLRMMQMRRLNLYPGGIPGQSEVVSARHEEVRSLEADAVFREAEPPAQLPRVSFVMTKDVAQIQTLGIERGGNWVVPASNVYELIHYLAIGIPDEAQEQSDQVSKMPGAAWNVLRSLMPGGSLLLEVNGTVWDWERISNGETLPENVRVILKPAAGLEERQEVIAPTATALRDHLGALPRVTVPSSVTDSQRVLIVTPDGLPKLLLAAVFVSRDSERPLLVEAIANDAAHQKRIQAGLEELGLKGVRVHDLKTEFSGNIGEAVTQLQIGRWQEGKETLVVTAFSGLEEITRFLGVPGTESELQGLKTVIDRSQAVWS